MGCFVDLTEITSSLIQGLGVKGLKPELPRENTFSFFELGARTPFLSSLEIFMTNALIITEEITYYNKCIRMDGKEQETTRASTLGEGPRVRSLTYQGVEDGGNGTGHHHAQDSFGPVSLAVHKHQAHIFKVTHGTSEELHEGVRQPVAGQHFHCILLDSSDAPVQGLGGGKTTHKQH